MGSDVLAFIRGVTAAGCGISALLFLKFWRASMDALFLWFAIAFALLAASYAALGLIPSATDWRLAVFGIRLAAFCVILYGIYEKNGPRP